MTKYYRVKAGGTVVDDEGRMHKPGSLVTSDQIASPKTISEHVAQGWLVEARDDQQIADVPVENAPGRQQMPTLNEGDVITTVDPSGAREQAVFTAAKPGIESPIGDAQSPEIASVAADAAQGEAIVNPIAGIVTQVQSPWTYDPQDLAGKPLNDLNAMVVEVGQRTNESVEPFTDPAEAIAQLSKDFKAN